MLLKLKKVVELLEIQYIGEILNHKKHKALTPHYFALNENRNIQQNPGY